MLTTYSLHYTDISGIQKIQEISVEEVGKCPLCHCAAHPHFDGGHLLAPKDDGRKVSAFVILYCTHCKQQFIAKYSKASSGYRLDYVFPSNPNPIAFDDTIENISPRFSVIYNQARQSEELGLDELSGMGYRKSLEFLIKDYLIAVQVENPDEIMNLLLGRCIDKIADVNIQKLAKSATWLGNDEAHYVRKHTDYDISHLKLFIKQTVNYIVGQDILKQADLLQGV